MYLPSSGASRDRTADLMSFRGTSLKTMQPNRDTSDSSLLLTRDNLYDDPESPLERFFQLASVLKRDISDLHAAFDTLLKKHKECLRPTFTDSTDTLSEISSLTASMNAKMEDIQRKINYFTMPGCEYPDRVKILANIRQMLTESFREFSVKFKIEQQTFSATLGKKGQQRKKKAKNGVDFDSLNFGMQQGQETRMLQVQRQREEQEIEQIAQRAEEIRNLFVELHGLIVEQGALVERIDYCISESLTNAVEAEHQIQSAASYQQKSRMWVCAGILGVLILILFVMALSK